MDEFSAFKIDKLYLKDLNLTEAEEQAIINLNSAKSVKKGTILAREGEVIKMSYHVITGCVRQYILVNGEEKTSFFYTENQSILSSASSNHNKASEFTLECLEDTTLSVVSTAQEIDLYQRFPKFQRLCRIATEEKFVEYQAMFALYMSSSPEERYLNILETRPELIHRVPQYQLASYLGIKPESLSRIRKRLATNPSPTKRS